MLCWSAGSVSGRRMQPKPSFGVFSNSGLNDAPLDGFAYHHRASSGLQVKRVFGERMRTDVSRETSRLTGMRAAPTSRAGTLRRPRIRIGNPRASPGGGRRGRASRGGAPAEGAPAAAFGLNGLAPASPAEGREAGRQRTHAMHDYRGLPTEERRETPGRKKWRGRRIVHSARSLPCAGKRSVAGRSPARVPSCAPPSNAYGCFT